MREAVERFCDIQDGSGYRYTVRVQFDPTRRPVVIIDNGTSSVVIEADQWDVLADAASRAIQFVGQHPDGPLPRLYEKTEAA